MFKRSRRETSNDPGPTIRAGSRRALHGGLLPAVMAAHANEELIPDILGLDMPYFEAADPIELANYAQGALDYTYAQAEERASDTGIEELREDLYVNKWGFGDRYFAPLAASVIGAEISDWLQTAAHVTQESFSFRDYSALFKQRWFGDLLVDTSLTQQGVLQPAATAVARRENIGSGYFYDYAVGYEGSPYVLKTD